MRRRNEIQITAIIAFNTKEKTRIDNVLNSRKQFFDELILHVLRNTIKGSLSIIPRSSENSHAVNFILARLVQL